MKAYSQNILITQVSQAWWISAGIEGEVLIWITALLCQILASHPLYSSYLPTHTVFNLGRVFVSWCGIFFSFFWFHDDPSVIVSWSSQRYAVIYNVPPVLWIKNLIHYVAWSHFPIFTRPQSCKWLSFQPYSLSWQEQWFLSPLDDNQQEINVLVLYELIADSMTTKKPWTKTGFLSS